MTAAVLPSNPTREIPEEHPPLQGSHFKIPVGHPIFHGVCYIIIWASLVRIDQSYIIIFDIRVGSSAKIKSISVNEKRSLLHFIFPKKISHSVGNTELFQLRMFQHAA